MLSPEQISDEDELYYRGANYRVRPKHHTLVLNSGYIPPKIFENKTDQRGMSTDWSKLRTPLETQKDHGTERLDQDFGVIAINVDKIRSTKEFLLDAVHDPKTENQAHSILTGFPSDIEGVEDSAKKELQTSIRAFLADEDLGASRWVLFYKV